MLFKRFWARRQESDADPRTETLMQEITAEFRAEELGGALPDEPLRLIPRVKFVARSEIGHARENNEDKFDFYEPDEEPLLAARVDDLLGAVRDTLLLDDRFPMILQVIAHMDANGSACERLHRALERRAVGVHVRNHLQDLRESVV